MSSRKVRRTKDKGQSPESLVHSPLSIVQGRRSMVVLLAAFAGLVAFAGCDWLLGLDTTPPTCQITSPADSASVNGVVQIAATASDSVGVERVDFYADGSLVGTDSSLPYSAGWDASGLAERTWHSLSCIAYDLAGNKGYSDTVAVQIAASGQTSVYHGGLDVAAGSHEDVWFNAQAGDTLAGDVMVVAGGALSSFMLLDKDNYQKYIANQSYTALFRQDNFSQMSTQQMVASAGRFYIVFVNNGSSVVSCWVRFVLE